MKTFTKGGIHPNDCKLATGAAIETLPLEGQVAVLLSQHIGAPALPVVAKGDRVRVGQLIGEAQSFVSANVHSPVSGVVARVDNCKNLSGQVRQAVYIDVDGDEWMDDIDRSDTLVSRCDLGPQSIVERIKAMGIVGLGGATFPTHVKYTIPATKKVTNLIINGVECEPFITSDHRLMMEHADEICVGIQILRRALGMPPATIGIECNKPEPIAIMREAASRSGDITVEPLKMHYPQGAEKQLIEALTGLHVPSGKLPLDVGCVVSNVSTTFAVYEAVQKNKPLIENFVTVTGFGLPSHHNYKARIGTTFASLIKAAGGLPDGTGKVISGGPMMGIAVANLDAPTTKGVGCVLLLDEGRSRRVPESPCLRCGRCVAACPMGLEPYLFSSFARFKRWDDALQHNVMDCIECGSCFYSCPAHKPLTDEIRMMKAKLRSQMIKK